MRLFCASFFTLDESMVSPVREHYSNSEKKLRNIMSKVPTDDELEARLAKLREPVVQVQVTDDELVRKTASIFFNV